MTKLARRYGAVAATALLALCLTACGDDDGNGDDGGGGGGGAAAADAPDDADKAEFCEVLTSTDEDIESADAAHELADELAEVGTPSDLSAGARDGFEAFVEFLATIDEDQLAELNAVDESADAEGGEPTDLDAELEQFTELYGDDGEKVVAFLFEAGFGCYDGDATANGGETDPTEGG